MKLNYCDKNYVDKRDVLIEYSKKNEIREFLNIICNSIYKNTDTICNNTDIYYNDKSNFKAIEALHYVKYNFEFDLKNLLKEFLITGHLSFENIYNNDKLIGFKKLDPNTLIPLFDYNDNQIKWTQTNNKNILNNHQITFISYSNVDNCLSYIEPLIRPYNLYRIIEETIVTQKIMENIVLDKNDTDVKRGFKKLFNLDEKEALDYFHDKLIEASKISKFILNNNHHFDPTVEIVYDNYFKNFLNDIKNEFITILTKPAYDIYLDMCKYSTNYISEEEFKNNIRFSK